MKRKFFIKKCGDTFGITIIFCGIELRLFVRTI